MIDADARQSGAFAATNNPIQLLELLSLVMLAASQRALALETLIGPRDPIDCVDVTQPGGHAEPSEDFALAFEAGIRDG